MRTLFQFSSCNSGLVDGSPCEGFRWNCRRGHTIIHIMSMCFGLTQLSNPGITESIVNADSSYSQLEACVPTGGLFNAPRQKNAKIVLWPSKLKIRSFITIVNLRASFPCRRKLAFAWKNLKVKSIKYINHCSYLFLSTLHFPFPFFWEIFVCAMITIK